MIDTNTKIMALLGTPLAQSYSAIMHNAAFEKLALNCIYMPIDCNSKDLATVVSAIRCMNFIGFNITKPYKLEIMQYLDEIEDSAKLIGAVNTVKKCDNKLIGYNTDGMGFIDSLTNELDFSINGKRFLIFGAGGGARAVAISLAFQGAKEISICNRNINSAIDLANIINSNIKNCAKAINSNEVEREIINCDCIINASGLGMYSSLEETPVNKNLLKSNMVVCDLTYNPSKTKLLLDAENAKCKILNGLGMLINQGARAFEIWLDLKAPIQDMKAAILEQINIIK